MTDTSFFDEPFSTEVWLLPWEDHGITHVLRLPLSVTVEVIDWGNLGSGQYPYRVFAPRHPDHDANTVVASGWALTLESAQCAGALSAHQLDMGVLCE